MLTAATPTNQKQVFAGHPTGQLELILLEELEVRQRPGFTKSDWTCRDRSEQPI